MRFLPHDRDSKFGRAFDEVFKPRASRSSAPRSGRRTRTRSPSAGSKRSAAADSTALDHKPRTARARPTLLRRALQSTQAPQSTRPCTAHTGPRLQRVGSNPPNQLRPQTVLSSSPAVQHRADELGADGLEALQGSRDIRALRVFCPDDEDSRFRSAGPGERAAGVARRRRVDDQ